MLNLNNLKTPGVYIDEVSTLPASVAAVATAIPAFVGYTENVVPLPKKISSFPEFVTIFGGPNMPEVKITITDEVIDDPVNPGATILVSRAISGPENFSPLKHNLYYSLRFFFDNGGGDCYVVSAGKYTGAPENGADDLKAAIDKLAEEDEPTIIAVPEAIHLSQSNANSVYGKAVDQAADLMDRFVLIDVKQADNTTASGDVSTFQDNVAIGDHPEFAAAYYPLLETTIGLDIEGVENQVGVVHEQKNLSSSDTSDGEHNNATFADIQASKNDLLAKQVAQAVRNIPIILPPSGAIAGIYTRVDNDRGVWKAPANVSVASVVAPTKKITDASQGDMNIDPNGGKSVNAIRAFTGRGILVWGARTLNGNDNEWRYIPVRRFFNFVEESTKKATQRYVFEPNDANTWNSIRAMIENFLIIQWKLGALQGAKADDAFFVKVGLGQTMTPQDILEGRLIVEIGMAVVRPAEFIILRYMHKLPES